MNRAIQTERQAIDKIDEQIVRLLDKRIKRVKRIGDFKQAQSLGVRDFKREREKMRMLFELAKSLSVSTTFIALVFRAIIEGSIILQPGSAKDGPVARTHRSVNLHWNTAGIIDPELQRPVCPVCSQPLL